MRTQTTTSITTTQLNTSKRATAQLWINAHEAGLLLHALKEYVGFKGQEVSSSTTRLIQKLEHYLFPNA